MEQVKFSDGASYDLMMGPWSRSAGELFLDWLRPSPGLDWLDVGCGSGAFTSLVVERCAPSSVLGIDPSEAQLDYARQRGLSAARFALGEAEALPVPDHSTDLTVAALVVHFMRDPYGGVAEMARVTKPAGMVAAYAWDLLNGGFPYDALYSRMKSVGYPPPDPPSPMAAGLEELGRIWTSAGLADIQSRVLTVSRTFAHFDDYWRTAITSPRIAAAVSRIPAEVLEDLRLAVEESLPSSSDGSVLPQATANAIFGRVPIS